MVDLDEANEAEQDDDKDATTYKIGEPIYSYTSENVESR